MARLQQRDKTEREPENGHALPPKEKEEADEPAAKRKEKVVKQEKKETRRVRPVHERIRCLLFNLLQNGALCKHWKPAHRAAT